jgi:hypothetical protein
MGAPLVAIDPGRSTGWAVFTEAGSLARCGACDGTFPFQVSPGVRVLIERPQVYSPRHSKGDPNDLITLAIRVGTYVERFKSQGAEVRLVLPHDWKGTIKKPIHHPRIYSRLDSAEQMEVDRGGRGLSMKAVEDMMDAVGLGVWARTGWDLAAAQ